MESELNEEQRKIQQESESENGAASVESSDDENLSNVASKIDSKYINGGDGTVGRMKLRVPLDKSKKFDLLRFRNNDIVEDNMRNENVTMRREYESEAEDKPWLLTTGTEQSATTFRGVKMNRTNKENYWIFVPAPGGVLEVYPVGDWHKFEKLPKPPLPKAEVVEPPKRKLTAQEVMMDSDED